MLKKKSSFLILLALYFAARLPWIFMVPMKEAPDEFSHFWVICFLHDHLRLPEAKEILAGGPSAVYGSLPQLGYIPHVMTAAIGKLVAPMVDISVTSRFGSLLAGIPLLWAACFFGRRIFGLAAQAGKLAYVLPLLVIFHPQIVLVHSYANSDATTASLAALSLVLATCMIEKGLSSKRSILLGLTVGWLILTKYPGVAVLPACGLGYLAAAWLNNQSLVKLFLQAALTGATTIGASLWWFMRSAAIFDGDFMGTNTMFHTWAVTYKKPLAPAIPASHIIKDKAWWRMTAFSYWGMFGYMTIYLWRPWYIVYLILMGTALGGGIKALILWLGSLQKKGRKYFSDKKAKLTLPATWLVLSSCFLTNIAAMIYASTKNLGGAQGRYLFPSEIPILALVAGGLYLTGKKTGHPLVWFFVVFNIVVYIAAFAMLAPMYGFRFLKTY